ncbi:MAG: DUF6436 domain-containing protein [Gammaproteobacteria bacterium]|nr:DUF6436 domain-containing protein [Gammaproteobacteria bacterium]
MMCKKHWLAGLIMTIWLISTAYAFWWFQTRDLRPFDIQAASVIESQALNLSLNALLAPLRQNNPGSAYLVHFWQPGCSCNRFNSAHVNAISKKYQQENFKLVTIVRPHPDFSDQQIIKMAGEQFASQVIIDQHLLLAGKARIPAAPAAAVIDEAGQLAYFGPYSDSTFCGLGGTAFVERVADLLTQGQTPSLLNTMVFGCFCDWDKTSNHSI